MIDDHETSREVAVLAKLRYERRSLRGHAQTLAERREFFASAWRWWRLGREELIWRARDVTARTDPFLEHGRRVHLSPSRIRRFARPSLQGGRRYPSAIAEGDWDIAGQRCDGHGFYDDLRAVAAGHPWSLTRVYSGAMEGIAKRSHGFREYADIHDWESRWLGGYDRLLSSMRTNGYLSQPELRKRRLNGFVAYNCDEVTVAVGRDGSFLLWEGRHRVAWATVLEVSPIPVQIMFRHRDWIEVRRRVAGYVRSHGGRAPQPLLHPDLSNVPAATDCAAIFTAVCGALSFERGILVDFSPGWGYYCHRFEDLGFACTAVCENEEDRWFLDTLRIAEDRSFAIVELGDRSLSECTFDVAIALGWHRAGSSDPTEIRRLKCLVRKTECREVVLEVPQALPASQDGTYVSAESLLEVLSATGGFSVATPILMTTEGSEVYRLVKQAGGHHTCGGET